MECRFTARAEQNLEEIGDYIATDNPVRALSFIEDIRARCRKIADMPQISPVIGVMDGFPARKRLFGSYRIYYAWQEEANVVWIVHVRHGARDEPEFEG